jgi:Tat protein secretion system quality control protein TatD with DNase activity
MGDRGGGREPKGASLRTSKKNPGAPSGKKTTKKAEENKGPVTSRPPPRPGPGSHFDCGAALLGRLFDRDRPRMLQRARGEGDVAAVVCWASDISKQQELADLCKEESGLCYFATGVHSDNIDRTKKNDHKAWLAKTEELAVLPECVAILSSLHLNREIATHFAQKALLEDAAALCDKLRLPLVLHLDGDEALEQALGILGSLGILHGGGDGSDASTRGVLLHNALVALNADVALVTEAAAAGLVLGVSAANLVHVEGETEEAAAAVDAVRSCAAAVPLEQLVVCSSSPWSTPQNIPDAYLRTMRNEPANLPHVVSALAQARGVDDNSEAFAQFSATLRKTSLRFFGLLFPEEESDAVKDPTGGGGGGGDQCGTEGRVGEADGMGVGKGKGKGMGKEEVLQGSSGSRPPLPPPSSEEVDVSAERVRKVETGAGMREADDSEDGGGGSSKEEEEEEEEEEASNAARLAALTVSNGAAHFACRKCRTFLFLQSDLLRY